MIKCRKIYGNLLLLSVIVFTLGVFSRPHIACLYSAEAALSAPSAESFRWETADGVIVYRNQHVCIPLFVSHDWLPPEDGAELRLHPEKISFNCQYLLPHSSIVAGFTPSRGPPGADKFDG